MEPNLNNHIITNHEETFNIINNNIFKIKIIFNKYIKKYNKS